ncbi:phosphopyruvate hydratase [Halobacteriovorax sp. GB3]|uniref:phosphopyruvate hydratase n=1 Tax=Halobacteriovorax sp. GB3 TaxID=2719615 RepID=UPI00236205FC|nr:phosphopyruvate hydratase [Halobacteriovorax sp. GB3]MDD0852828.1 phosphopyruvate hydratase [Halobacteriovorax sp. GB3]
MSKITNIIARQILDSRGNPTVEAEVHTELGSVALAAVPSGASTGTREALELRDGDKSYYVGKSVRKAVSNVNDIIKPQVLGMEVTEQRNIDYKMIEIDGTENKEKLGANAILAVSMAVCRAGAMDKKMPLFRYMNEFLKIPMDSDSMNLPAPLMNIINGGEHASNNLDIQEFMIVPHMQKSFSENFRAGVETFHALKKVLSEQNYSTNVGDEGGFAPNLQGHEEAIECILKAIKNAGYEPGRDISISLDSASSEFYRDGKYHIENKALSSEEMVKYYSDLCDKYPIYSIEDGLDESDYEGWEKLTRELGDRVVLVGDDVFVTNKKILQKGIDRKMANSILVKVNQIGSLTETFETLDLAFKNNYSAIISHRSGETGDSFIADLAVACAAGHIKTGSASRSDRMEKYNQLLRIEEALGSDAKFNVIK